MMKFRNFVNKIAVLAFVSIIAFSLSSCEREVSDSVYDSEYKGLTVSFIDVGQGDSILLECGRDTMLIDAGENDKGDEVLDYLSSHNIKGLTYAVCTHPHSDHVGGMDTVLKKIKAKNFICPKTDYSSKTWNDVLSVVDENNTRTVYASPNKTYDFGEGTFTIYAPQKNSIYSDCNNYSVVMKMSYGKNSFLFEGDAETVSEKEMISEGYNLEADVLKLGHHGSGSSSCTEFLDKVNPQYGIISCGKGNEYGHPHSNVLYQLERRGIKTYRTDVDGTVVAKSDGKSISFERDTAYSSKNNVQRVTDKEAEATTFGVQNEVSSFYYIGNKNSHKFHIADCPSVEAMLEENKIYFNDREEAVGQGYSPCQQCYP